MLSVKVTHKGGRMKKQKMILEDGQELGLDHVVRYKSGKKKGQVKGVVFTAASMGRMGGTQRAKNLTAKQRSDIARKGAQARWASKPTKKGGK